MEECPPCGDYTSVKGDPSKTASPPARWTPSPAVERAQGEGLSRGDDVSPRVSQPDSHSLELKRKKFSSGTSESQVLKKYEDEFLNVVDPKLHLHRLKHKKVITEALISRIETADSEDAKYILLEHLLHNADVAALREYCEMAIAADAFPKMQKLGEKMLNELSLAEAGQASQQSDSQTGAQEVPSASLPQSVSAEGSHVASRTCDSRMLTSGLSSSNNPHTIMHTYTTGILTCDLDIICSKKEPEKAIKSLFFNAYSILIRILRTCYDSIKMSALDAARMQQVDATEEEVRQAQDISTLFQCLKVDRNWDEIHFLGVAITGLPPEESEKRDAALLVLGHYKSYLRAYRRATSIKKGTSEFGLFQHKRGREERWVVTEVTVDKEITDYTYDECLELWKLFLIKALEIPEDCIEFRYARAGNSTTLVFMLAQTYAEGTKEKLSKPAAVWLMKELGILRVFVAGVVNMDLREVLSNVLITNIREGLESGVDFMSVTKVWSPLICSLLDRVPEPKITQLSWVLPYFAGPFGLSIPEPVVEIRSEHDPSHVDDEDDTDSTAHQEVPVTGLVKDAVPSQNLELQAAASASLLEDLLVAAAEGRLHEVQSLLDSGRCKVNDEDEEGFTAVVNAAHCGRLTVLRTLVEQYGGNVLHRKKRGRNAFHLCAVGGHLAVAEYLAPNMKGHLFDSDDAGYTALHWAAQEGQSSMVEYLVRSCGFDVKSIDKSGTTPLLRAAQRGHAEVLCFLLENGSSVMEQDNEGRNAFLLCAAGGHSAIAEYLAPKMKGHLFDGDNVGSTALHLAANFGHLSMVEYLVKSCGFDVKAIDKSGTTPLLRAAQEGHTDVARILLGYGSNVTEQNNDGWTAVLLAAHYGHNDLVQELCESFGADFLHKKKDGCNAFHVCADSGHLAVAKYLAPKMKGHLFDPDDAGYTALHWAAQEGQLSMVEYLVRFCGFDMKARDKWGYTPFLRAAAQGHAEVARFLLKSGTVFHDKNRRGESALQIAVRKGHLDVVKVLVQVYRDSHMESEVRQFYLDLAHSHHHEHVVKYLSREFPSLKRKVPVLQPQPSMYPNVWSISGLGDPDD